MTKPISIEIGICKTCRHYSETWDDPGASDCSLSPAQMLVDAGCAKEDEVTELDNENIGQDGDNQCPLWEIPLLPYCRNHKEWVWDECGKCMEQAWT